MKRALPKVSIALICTSLLLSCNENESVEFVEQTNQTYRKEITQNNIVREIPTSLDFVRFPSTQLAKKSNPKDSERYFVTDLESLFENSIPETESFKIDPKDEVFLTTENGTQLYFQAESFLTDSGKQVVDSVTINVQVFDDNLDYASGNLVTQTTRDQLLQTGGMFHITAEANNEGVFLNPGLPAQIYIPVSGDKVEGMHSYYGKEKDGVIQWVDAKDAFPQYKENTAIEFGKPQKKFHLSIKAEGRKSEKAIESFISEDTEENWLDWMEKQNLSGTELENYLSVSNHNFSLDLKFAEDGSMIYLFNERELPQNIATQLAHVLEKAPKILYESTQGALLTDKFHLRISGSYDESENTHAERATRHFGKAKYEMVTSFTEDNVQEYVLEFRTLGFLNCDGELKGVKRQNAIVRIPDQIKDAKVWIILAGIAVNVRGLFNDNNAKFMEIPIGVSAKIVTIGTRDGIPVMSKSYVLVEKNQSIPENAFTRFSHDDFEKTFKNF